MYASGASTCILGRVLKKIMALRGARYTDMHLKNNIHPCCHQGFFVSDSGDMSEKTRDSFVTKTKVC